MEAKLAAQLLDETFQANGQLPDSLHDSLNIESAYRAQFSWLDLRQGRGEKLCGWKVGLTAKAMQQQQAVHEPCLGHLLVSGHQCSPAHLDFSALTSPGFENELCLKLARPLSGRISYEQARAAIGAVAPALEIIEKRSNLTADFPLALATNAQQRYFVTGEFIEFEKSHSLADTILQLFINDNPVEEARGAEVLGDPVNSLVWLSEKLYQFGHTLKAGQFIMSGSFTKQYALNAGERIRADFTPFGSVEAFFTQT